MSFFLLTGLLGQMSVQKLWLASDKINSEFTAELNPNALDPNGKITRDSDGRNLEADSLPEGIAQSVRVSALCNVAS